jgi:hypothetical protein
MGRLNVTASIAAFNAVVVAGVLAASCAPKKDGSLLTGRERFGWIQPAAQTTAVRFAVYADGSRFELPDAVCHPSASGQAECDAPLPPLARGKHSLQVVSWTVSGGKVIESPKSAAITIEIAGADPAARPRNP